MQLLDSLKYQSAGSLSSIQTSQADRQTVGGEQTNKQKKSKISTNLIAYSVSELTNNYLDLPSETSFDENIKCILITEYNSYVHILLCEHCYIWKRCLKYTEPT